MDQIIKMVYTQIVFISCILENFFYTLPLEGFCIVHDHIDTSFLFLLQKDFCIAHEHIVTFYLSLLQKHFGTFHVLLFETFLFFLANSYLSFLCIEKNYKKIFYQVFYML